MKAKIEALIDRAMKSTVHDFEIEGIVITKEQQELAKKRVLNQISEEEYVQLVLEDSDE